MAGRKTKLDAKLQAEICKLLAKGATDKTACERAGIAVSTFHNWLSRGETEPGSEYMEFLEAVTQARAKAHVAATVAFQSGFSVSHIKETITETFIETRLNRKGEPYEYKRVMTRTVNRSMPPDWKAGEAWLKRRDRDNWSEKSIHEVEDWRTEIVALLRDGKITLEQVEEELGSELAQELFKSTGLSVITARED